MEYLSLSAMYARFDAISEGTMPSTHWDAHAAILDRLATNQRRAEEIGWTSCALERIGGMGRLAAWGVPPGSTQRHRIPDWSDPSN
jgi:hypothetical protein